MHPFSNSNPSPDVVHFDQLAHDWWDPRGSLWTLHQLNPLRLAWIKSFQPLKDKKVLDVGCGGGLLSEALAYENASVLGVDLAPSLIEIATNHAAQSTKPLDLKYLCASLDSLESKPSFDLITCMEMLEHVENPELIIKACAERLLPGGWLFLSTINQTYQAWFKAILLGEHLLKWVPRGSHRLDRFITPADLATWAGHFGLQSMAIKGISYRPLFARFELSNQVDTNYLMAFQKN